MNIRPLLIGILGLAIVVLLVWAVMRARQGGGQPSDQAQQVQTQPVPMAKRDISQGQLITEDDLVIKQMTDEEMGNLPSDALTDPEKIVGGTAAITITKEGNFTSSNVLPAPEGVSDKVEPGYVAVTISAPEAPSLYDLKFLDPEDRVDIFGVQADQQARTTTSVRLASNVRILAVDKVYDKFKEEQRKKKLRAEIEQLKQDRAKAAAATPPMQPEALKTTFDDPIAAKEAEIDPEIEHPSITVEVTNEQSQKIALWRETAKINIALHRQQDAEVAIFDAGTMMLPPPEGEGGEEGGLFARGPRTVLTLDDVVPLQQRDPKEYVQRVTAEDQLERRDVEKEIQRIEDEVRRAELQVELSNIKKYGSRIPPPTVAAGAPPPAATAMPSQEIASLSAKVDQLTAAVTDLRSRASVSERAAPRSAIEIIRGSERTMVEY